MQTNLAIIPRATFDERPNALLIEHVTYDEWLAMFATIYAEYNRYKWYMVDWFGFGLRAFPDEFWQAIEDAQIPEGTWRNNLRIFNAYPTEHDRVLGCSVSAHEAAIVLEPQKRYQVLQNAADLGKGRDWVRDEVRRIKGDGGKVEPYRTDAWITRDGVLHISGLPVYMQGKDVTVTVKLLESAA